MKKWLISLMTTLILVFLPSLGEGQVIQLDSLKAYQEMGIDLSEFTWAIQETEMPIPLEQIVNSSGPIQMEKGYRLKRYLRKKRIWMKAEVTSHAGGSFYIRPGINPISHAYIFQGSKLINSQDFGFYLPSSDLEIPTAAHFFSVDLNPEDTLTLVIRNDPIFPIPLTLAWEFRDQVSFYYYHTQYLVVQALFHGAFWILILYILLQWVSQKDTAYLWYIAYLFCLSYAYFVGKELFRLMPIPSRELAKFLLDMAGVFPMFVVLLYFTFARHFLHLQSLFPKVDQALKMFVRGQFLLLPILVYVNLQVLPNSVIQLLVMLIDILATGWLIYKLFRSDNYLARIFVLGSMILILCGMASLGVSILGLFPNHHEDYIFQVGVLLEVLVFSYGLGVRSSITEKEKQRAQAQLLEQQAKANQLLEAEVERRTQELNDKNAALILALDKLKATQSQLVASERLASVGQLTAGVAHEINNPINFVVGSVDPLKRDLAEIQDWVQQIQHLSTKGDAASIDRLIQDQEVGELVIEIRGLLEGIEEGAFRIRDIVRSLRTFSRIHEEEFKQVDIHEGLDSTLVLLQHLMQDRIQVKKAYGNIPMVEALPGKLNQVFMNLLSNAIQAIPGEGEIGISTFFQKEHGQVLIRIEDTGVGIQESDKDKIFEPFFTTKAEGEGMGLGLSISLGIVQQHGGQIEVEDKENEGTNFTVILPIRQSLKKE